MPVDQKTLETIRERQQIAERQDDRAQKAWDRVHEEIAKAKEAHGAQAVADALGVSRQRVYQHAWKHEGRGEDE